MTTLTITMTDRAPIKIDRDLWPIIAGAREGSPHTEHYWRLFARRHNDGRSIVYGIYTSGDVEDPDRRGGVLLNQGDNIAAAIRSVGEHLEFEEHLIEQCIADLPAETIE